MGLGLLLTASAVFLAFLMLRFVFRPLEVATTAMQRMAAGDLNHRVPNRGAIAEVADTFNTMATRVQQLVHGQRDLMAAVSHELRTLTRMRLNLELLSDADDPAPRVKALTNDAVRLMLWCRRRSSLHACIKARSRCHTRSYGRAHCWSTLLRASTWARRPFTSKTPPQHPSS